MFKFKKIYLFIVAILICGIGVLSTLQAKADASSSITILSPNGGETLIEGSVYRIKWDALSAINKVNLSFSDGSAYFNWIATSIPNIGYYDWPVNVGKATNKQFKIYIEGLQYGAGIVNDQSDNYFNVVSYSAIPPFSIIMLSPNGGETLTRGSIYRIKWDSSNIVKLDPSCVIEDINLKYSSTPGVANWITTSAPAIGYYDWTVDVDERVNTQFKIIVNAILTCRQPGVGSVADISDNYFSVVSATTTIPCKSICKNIGARFEGWYDLCTNELIKLENCGGINVCVKEGKSLGAVVLDDNRQCCEGLRPYIESGIIGTRGICKKISDASDPQITQINASAGQLHQNKLDEILSELKQLRDKIKEQASEIKYLRNLTAGVKDLAQSAKDAINDFITYGVDSNTQKLGAGERAAVISSYKSAFDKLPETEAELTDAIKIANGRFPSITNDNAEKKAKEQFKKIYKKIADMNNANDSAAIKVMAYGLRQKAENRSLNSEKAGIKIFKDIYKFNPSTTEDWNAMQAITYSGAKKELDTDRDLLPDDREKELGTNPNKADSDGDGYKDGAEVEGGYDPLKK